MVALFIFTILSILLTGTLHRVIDVVVGTERHAAQLRALQMALLKMQRDIEQPTPFVPSQSSESQSNDKILDGHPSAFTLIHASFSSKLSQDQSAQTSLTRTSYYWRHHCLWQRMTINLETKHPTLLAPRCLLKEVQKLQFIYYDDQHHAYTHWPITHDSNNSTDSTPDAKTALPQAIKMIIELKQQGQLTQLYTHFT